MTLDLRDCVLFGPALPEPFVRFDLAALLARLGLLKEQGKRFEQDWGALRRQLRVLGGVGGPQRVCNQVLVPLAHCLGYGVPLRQDEVSTREGMEDGGWLVQARCGTTLRAWSVGFEADLDAPHRSGRACFSAIPPDPIATSRSRSAEPAAGERTTWRRTPIAFCWRSPRQRRLVQCPKCSMRRG